MRPSSKALISPFLNTSMSNTPILFVWPGQNICSLPHLVRGWNGEHSLWEYRVQVTKLTWPQNSKQELCVLPPTLNEEKPGPFVWFSTLKCRRFGRESVSFSKLTGRKVLTSSTIRLIGLRTANFGPMLFSRVTSFHQYEYRPHTRLTLPLPSSKKYILPTF